MPSHRGILAYIVNQANCSLGIRLESLYVHAEKVSSEQIFTTLQRSGDLSHFGDTFLAAPARTCKNMPRETPD
jgi:hypothetical protein